MTTDRSPPVPLWSATAVVSAMLVVAALTAALSAWAYTGQAARRVEDVQVQTELARAFQARAIACLDQAAASLGDPSRLARAESSLEISRGITLCLVKNRDQAVVEVDGLATCVREVEVANGLIDPAAGATFAAPPC